MKAVILAGGKGTRLQHLTAEIPKPMVPISGKPIVERQIELLQAHNITDITLITNHLSAVLEDYLQDGSKWKVNIKYFVEPMPLGTVGGIKAIEKDLQEDFIVLYGDVMLDMDIDRLIKFHQQKKSDATIVVHPNDHPYDSDLVEMDRNDKIIAFHSKPHADNFFYTNMVNAGMYVFTPKIFDFLEANKKADFGKNIFPAIYDKLQMFGYNTPEYIKDMGTLDRLEKVTKDLESGKINRLNLKNKRAAIFLDRDGVLNKKNDYIYKPEQFHLFDNTAAAVKTINKSEYLAVVVTNQPVIARGMCTEEELRNVHKKMETQLGNERAKLDGIYYCPHHPDKGFEREIIELKINCDCRKPRPGMLLQAEEFFNIDLPKSFLIGDSWRDIEAGRTAGVTTIGVMTGDGNKEGHSTPDYLMQDVEQAVNFIVKDPLASQFEMIEGIYNHYDGKKPFVIAIGGNSRSGKSTLSTYIKKQFRKRHIVTKTIRLDHWIKTNFERKYDDDVFDRFQSETINNDLNNFFDGYTIEIESPYVRHPKHDVLPVQIKPGNDDIIIIEGVVALGLESVLSKANLKIFVEVEEATHKARLFDYYTWKGYNADKISDIYDKRKVDEFDKIVLTQSYADLVIPTVVL